MPKPTGPPVPLVILAAVLLVGLGALTVATAVHSGWVRTDSRPGIALADTTGSAPEATKPDAPEGGASMTESDQPEAGKYRKLTPEEEAVIVHKGTEAPFTGEYDNFFGDGIYTCRRCGAMLYRSEDKFHSGCGWPAFDDALPGAVKQTLDADGVRTEITCANCGAHLGHVFVGEHLTDKNTRYCVNSISMLFVPKDKVKFGRAIFAGGCFWGVQYLFQKQPGVVQTTVGYTGGTEEHPTYESMHAHNSGHAEAVEVLFDPVRVSFEDLAKFFFEIHDPTQANGQGPDLGSQYRSAIFYTNEQQKQVAEKLIAELKARGMNIVTQVAPAGTFWPAEQFHQDYYLKRYPNGGEPPCHVRHKLW